MNTRPLFPLVWMKPMTPKAEAIAPERPSMFFGYTTTPRGRMVFSLRGDCDVCDLKAVPCQTRQSTMICALCATTGA